MVQRFVKAREKLTGASHIFAFLLLFSACAQIDASLAENEDGYPILNKYSKLEIEPVSGIDTYKMTVCDDDEKEKAFSISGTYFSVCLKAEAEFSPVSSERYYDIERIPEEFQDDEFVYVLTVDGVRYVIIKKHNEFKSYKSDRLYKVTMDYMRNSFKTTPQKIESNQIEDGEDLILFKLRYTPDSVDKITEIRFSVGKGFKVSGGSAPNTQVYYHLFDEKGTWFFIIANNNFEVLSKLEKIIGRIKLKK